VRAFGLARHAARAGGPCPFHAGTPGHPAARRGPSRAPRPRIGAFRRLPPVVCRRDRRGRMGCAPCGRRPHFPTIVPARPPRDAMAAPKQLALELSELSAARDAVPAGSRAPATVHRGHLAARRGPSRAPRPPTGAAVSAAG
jgi:hypothetical protein